MKILGYYKTYPFAYFFLAILCVILLSPLVEGSLHGGRFLRILFTLMMATAVFAASTRRTTRVAALCMALPWLFLTWTEDTAAEVAADYVANILFVTFNLFVFTLIISRVNQAETIDFNILCGALALYLLIAVLWAVSYQLLEQLAPGSFAAGATPIPFHKFLYFSLTTLTTLGYGDILPTAPFAGIWATLEAVTGVLYIAVLVARFVSLYRQ